MWALIRITGHADVRDRFQKTIGGCKRAALVTKGTSLESTTRMTMPLNDDTPHLSLLAKAEKMANAQLQEYMCYKVSSAMRVTVKLSQLYLRLSADIARVCNELHLKLLDIEIVIL
jgi:hypothetical protein